jgi:long-subunit acyl-CoA synthetase (AMP-forming)
MPITIKVSEPILPDALLGFEQVIYTSGSSGVPKGVLHGAGQIETVVRALASASGATSDDRYLPILRLPMLLETNYAIFVVLQLTARLSLQ